MGRKVVSPCSCNRSDTTFSCRARVCTAYHDRSASMTGTGADVCQICPLLLIASPSESHSQTRPVSLHMNVLGCRTTRGDFGWMPALRGRVKPHASGCKRYKHPVKDVSRRRGLLFHTL